MRKRLALIALGLAGTAAFAAIVVPNTKWQALMMEISSNHDANWQRDQTGQLVVRSDKSPDQSYKPWYRRWLSASSHTSDLGQDVNQSQSVRKNASDLAGVWDIAAWTETRHPDGRVEKAPFLNFRGENQYQVLSSWNKGTYQLGGYSPMGCYYVKQYPNIYVLRAP